MAPVGAHARRRWRSATCLLTILLGCGSPAANTPPTATPPAAQERGLLDRVPASTPYVWAQLDPFPKDYLDKLLANADAYQRVFREVRRVRDKHPEIMEDLDLGTRVLLAVLDELEGKLTRKGLRKLGLDLRGRVIIYGQGLWPVLRAEIADGGKLRGVAERVAKKLGADLPTMKHGQRQLWHAGQHLGSTEVDLVLAVSERELVIALTPTGRQQAAFLDRLFSERASGRSLAEKGTLAELSQRHQIAGGGIGFVDFTRLADEVAKALPDADAGCAAEMRDLTRSMPRWVFGTREVSRTAITARLVVETDPTLQDALERSRAAVPALAPEIASREAFAIGAGLDLRSFSEYSAPILAALGNKTFACQPLQDIPPLAQALERSLSELVASPAKTLLGAQLLIRDLEISTGLPTDLNAAIFLGTREPGQLVDYLAESLPSLRKTPLEPGAAPVAVDVPGAAGMPFFQHVHAAAGQGGLALSVGSRATELLALVNDEPAGGLPLFVMHSTEKFWRTVTSVTNVGIADAMRELDEKLADAISDLERDHYESFTMVARVVSAGVQVDFEVRYPADGAHDGH